MSAHMRRPCGDSDDMLVADQGSTLNDVLNWLDQAHLDLPSGPVDEPGTMLKRSTASSPMGNIVARGAGPVSTMAGRGPPADSSYTPLPGGSHGAPVRKPGATGPAPRGDRGDADGSNGAICSSPNAGWGGCVAPEEPLSLEEEEDNEWTKRQRCTGSVGRLVSYGKQERPRDDLVLRGGGGRHVVVAAVKSGGPASVNGVKVGDRLVSVDGKKDLLEHPAEQIAERLQGPVLLVFVGFVGKLQAEVRLGCSPKVCGLGAQEPILGNFTESRLTVCEERVFNSSSASLFFKVSSPSDMQGDTSEGSGCSPLLFELQRREASNLVTRALEAQSKRDDSRSHYSCSRSDDTLPASAWQAAASSLHADYGAPRYQAGLEAGGFGEPAFQPRATGGYGAAGEACQSRLPHAETSGEAQPVLPVPDTMPEVQTPVSGRSAQAAHPDPRAFRDLHAPRPLANGEDPPAGEDFLAQSRLRGDVDADLLDLLPTQAV
eukprot:TRINITY_DN23291_c0_g3_i1.p1 TRINITY_DN23291_c0_g3~~TRINITY_DN23291_c0_g3_i1.p1  ORF type:complete len:489 (+),score=97.96 TRINITY_DN23291_c0_g3_i1:150-1616(+)